MSRPRKCRWAKLKGDFWRNRKVQRLSLAARGLLVTAWSFAADQETDGHVPVDMLEVWAKRDAARLIEELVSAGFLDVDPERRNAWAHDWLAHNIGKAEWDAKLSADLDRKRDGNGGRRASVSDRKLVGMGEGFQVPAPLSLSSSFSSPSEKREDPLGGVVALVRSALRAEGIVPADLTSSKWTTIAEWVLEHVGLHPDREPSDVCASLARGFADDPRAKAKGHPLPFLAKNPKEYLDRRAGPVTRDELAGGSRRLTDDEVFGPATEKRRKS